MPSIETYCTRMATRNANSKSLARVVFLVGNAGSGKSTVASKLAADGFELLAIDDYYRRTLRTDGGIEWSEDRNYRRQAYQAMKSDVRDVLKNGGSLIIETTGASSYTTTLFSNLKRKRGISTIVIHLTVSVEKAQARVRRRNRTAYPIKCPPAFINMAAAILRRPSLPIDFHVNGNADRLTVLRAVRSILGQSHTSHQPGDRASGPRTPASLGAGRTRGAARDASSPPRTRPPL